MNCMTFDFYAAVSSLDVRFAQILIGLLKIFLLRCIFLIFLYVVLVDNNRHVMSHMNTTKKNLINLDLNPVRLVRTLPYLLINKENLYAITAVIA